MPKFKRPEPIEILPNDEFESFKRLRPRARITPTTATTPSVAVYGRDNMKSLCTPTCVSLYFDSPRSAVFKEDTIDEGLQTRSRGPTPRNAKFPAILPAPTNSKDEVTLIKINPKNTSSGVTVRANNQTFNIVLDYEQEDSLSVQPEQPMLPPPSSLLTDVPFDVIGSKPGPVVSKLMSAPQMWNIVNKIKKGKYSCTHCTQKFRTLRDLAAHIDEERIHRPHSCNEPNCPWSIIGFSKRSECSRHTKYQHQTKTKYRCQVEHCQKTFTRKDSLRRHTNLIHSDNLF
ncbi:hypothetical protein TRICI_003571 [Trichomonascus ciferrii]|uniref:C2H2-type domain-containing protein n=1 Tax=Trichomonascus ciferrii TaxID=44093 RepID=A0A642V8J9_9ASCO|nr:hypothetical protein TRICI_003571 [Trichomonascus ciferrii]